MILDSSTYVVRTRFADTRTYESCVSGVRTYVTEYETIEKERLDLEVRGNVVIMNDVVIVSDSSLRT